MPLVTFNDDYDASSTFFAKHVDDSGVWFSKGEASRIAEDCATMPGTDYAFRWNERINNFETTEETDDGIVWAPVELMVDADGVDMYRMGVDWEWRVLEPRDHWDVERLERLEDLDVEVNRLILAHNRLMESGELHYEIGSW